MINPHPFLEKLERIIDPAHLERTRELQKRAFAFQPVDHIPTAIDYPVADHEWPTFRFDEFIADPDKMLLNELRPIYLSSRIRDDRLTGIRANFGTGIIASLFGCPIRVFDHALPIALPLGETAIDHLLQKGLPSFQQGQWPQIEETLAYFRETLTAYPLLSKEIGFQLFDIQGPFDNASIIWGSEIYLALIDQPDRVCDLMRLITETTREAVKRQRVLDGRALKEHDGAWNHLGGVCVRNDSTVNLSGDAYRNWIQDFDRQLLEPWGGWIHFCGQAHQWWKDLLSLPGLRGINPYQGEFYSLADMYRSCANRGVALVQWTTPLSAECREQIHTGLSRICHVDSLDAALRAVEQVHRTGHADPLPE
ncbi:hypothetical protein JW992_12420 [candidate division KSB1 bacterium]|nr:hypothetical protein [candidate division KSB1 bacterium]